MSETNPKFKVTIDGVEVEVDPGTTILNAACNKLNRSKSIQ
jgi:NADH dehydrogenase/NADH:ubiquinone oxidoreductase subunit G